MFTALDYVTLLGYLLGITLLGLYFSKRNHDFNAYMFGSGKMPWPAIGISLIATSVSATTFLGNPAESYGHNMAYLMCNLGSFLAIGVIAIVFIPRFRALQVQSAYEILEHRFGRVQRRVAAGFFTCHLLLRTGILLYGPSLVLSQMFGMDIPLAICLTSLLAIVYTWFGGLQAVVWTDVVQFVILFCGGLLAIWYCAEGSGGFVAMWDVAAAAGKTQIFDFSLDPANPRTLLSAGLVYTIFEVAIRGCDQQFVQRYQACRDVRAANLSSLLSVVLGLMVGVVFYGVGVGLYSYYQQVAHTLPEGTGVDHVFPYFIKTALPPGITGLLVAAIFAAAMSSLDSAITALSNTTVTDFFPKPASASEGERLAHARFWVLVWGVLGTAAAFLCLAGQSSLLTKALFFTSLFTGPLLGLFLMALLFPRTQPRATLVGAGGGMVTLLLFSKIPVLPEGLWEPLYQFSWPWNPLISLAGTLITAGVCHGALSRRL